jgi:coenzyme F420-0:L-glutamate ligase/coenzyme F420-1:gamma-L-glutamate ligase
VTEDRRVEAIPIAGLPEIVNGDHLGELIVKALDENGLTLRDGDLVIVAQKVVSKAEGATAVVEEQEPSERALELAETVEKDPKLVQIVLDQSKRVVKTAPGVLIVETVHGFICANAGIDQSNIEGEGLVTTLPEDSFMSAAVIRKTIVERTGCDVGVLVSDTFNRPWREGSINVAIGVAGLDPLRDLRGTIDDFDREMTTSTVSLADEVASTAQLVMGESGRVPVAIVRGVEWERGEFPADRLLRPAERDLFR